MPYVQTYWLHDFPDEPTQFFAELDDDLFELRKVVRYRDGTLGYADDVEHHGGTFLSPEPYPPLEALGPDTRFVTVEIPAAEFEQLWKRRRLSPETTEL